jgi:hypothetical protein
VTPSGLWASQESLAASDRSEADKAWQQRELEKVIALYTAIEDELTASEKAKLAYAKEEAKSTESISGKTFRAIEIAAIEFRRQRLNVEDYRIIVRSSRADPNTIVVSFDDPDRPPNCMGSSPT